MIAARLEELSRGFREDYLPYDELTAQVRDWAEAFPELVRVTSIGETPEGRSLWLLTIGPEPDRIRPAVWIDGNMHAVELCGSSVALAIAEDILWLHLSGDNAKESPADQGRDDRPDPASLPPSIADGLRDVLFYILPRMSPDGAESILAQRGYVRSVPRDDRPNRNRAYWRDADVDGDGQCLLMRVEDPAGEFVESREEPNLLLLRQIDDPGPYYKLYPEGYIENFNGRDIPAPYFLSDNRIDLNRNFPWSWAPESIQDGAGEFPASEPESRAVVEFASGHPHIFAWLNLHTFGGVFIRPLGDGPDTDMNPQDLALYRQIGAWATELTGYPMVSGYEQFTYVAGKPLRGSLSNYAFRQRGCIAYVVELWDLFEQLGVGTDCQRFVDRYSRFERPEMLRLARWDREHNHSRVVQPWTKCDHEQLGPVEVGGLDAVVGVWNPPYERVAEVCRAQSQAFMHVAAMAPRLIIEEVSVERLGTGAGADNDASDAPVWRVQATVRNLGYLPTYILASAKKLAHNEELYATLSSDGCRLDAAADGHRNIGHLAGWGRGLYSGLGPLIYGLSSGSDGAHTLSYLVHGTGRVTLRVGSCRVGYVTRTISIG